MENLFYQINFLDVEAVKKIITGIELQTKDISDKKDLKKVATISANGEEEIADLIVTAIEASGIDGDIYFNHLSTSTTAHTIRIVEV